jgi:hypothetical protein
VAILVIWMLCGAVLVKLWTAWPRLPDRVATHFGLSLQPDGWSSKGKLAAVILIAVLGQAALATVVLLHMAGAARPTGLIMLVVNIVLVSTFWQVINYNAEGTRFQAAWILGPLILLLAGVVLLSQVLHFYGP